MSDISPVPETKVTFFKSSGHKHDGVTSSIIDTSKYSIFDFGTDITTSSRDRSRELSRTNNQNRFNQYIANFISTQILAPAGIELLENSVRGIHIGADEVTANNIAANTITANEIAANTITASQIAANTITANQITANTITAAQIATNTITANQIAANTITSNEIQTGTITASDLANTITFNAQVVQSSQYAANNSTGWALLSNGDVSFGSGTFRGSLDIGGPDNDSLQVDTDGRLWIGHRAFGSAPFRVSSDGATSVGNGLVTIATNGATSVAGVLTVSNTADISGNLNVTSNSNISGNLTVGGTTINVGSAGSTTTIAGTLQVNSGTTVDGSLTVKGSTIVIGNSTGASTTTVNGSTTVNGGLTVSGTTVVNNTITLSGAITANGNITLSSGKYIDVGTGSVIGGNTVFSYILDPFGFRASYTAAYGGAQILNVGERIQVVGGTVLEPSIGFVGDNNTGLYRPANNQLGIAVGGDIGAFFTKTNTTLKTSTTSVTTTLRASATFLGLTNISIPASNRHLKKNIEEINNGLDIISLLKPSTFEWKPFPDDTEFEASLRPFIRDFGFIAEEVAEVNPRLACWKPNDVEGLTEAGEQHAINALDEWIPHYWSESGVIAVCVAAIKELKSRIEHLETELGYNS